MRLSHKIFAFTFVIAVATLAAVAVHTVDQTTRLLTEQSIDSAERQADREASILTEHVDAAKSDALLLANVDAARRLSEATSEDDKAMYGAELERVFQTVMAEKPYYTQVRLIGTADQGRELVRVNQDRNGIRPVPVDRLQSKADRYYFRETVSLGENQTYVSKLDLNREHGRIVEPHQPVLRISTTVFSSQGDLVAIIVINIDMNVLLGDIVAAGPGGFPVLTDSGGDFLYHPDTSRPMPSNSDAMTESRTSTPSKRDGRSGWAIQATLPFSLSPPAPISFRSPGSTSLVLGTRRTAFAPS